MKSLDALNVKLMSDRVEEKPPDMEQYKRSQEALGINAVRQVRKIHHDMDAALLMWGHPGFKGAADRLARAAGKVSGAVMNEVMGGAEPAD
jgi:hypothetical protein